ncbi:MAG: hypothetical protein CMM58_08645 [Rhodospirillaceae bacterium]|nr:hypothetical protein [Rhodospirillaceae bacterium]|tara:strand:- start:1076 stop:1858 length:783 start_codon:yes stop_codon:yes gene_type:complete
MTNRLDGRYAVVTGGASGIGRSIVQAFLRFGAKVVIADKDIDLAQATAKECAVLGDVYALKCDVTNSMEVRSLAESAVDLLGEVNVLVNNAGLSGRGFIEEISEEKIDALLNVNLKAVILCAQAFASILKKGNNSVMINMSSQAGKRGWPELSVYGATKAGVLGMNRALAIELAPHVRVNAICPGYISDVGMAWRGWEEKSIDLGGSAASLGNDFAEENIPLSRLQTADDIANAASFLASSEASEITGAAINVGGGVVMD